jgi:hypothetical protein
LFAVHLLLCTVNPRLSLQYFPHLEQGKSIFIQSMQKQVKDYIEAKAKASGFKTK